MNQSPLIPNWLYNFNHWLMLISLGAFLFIIAIELLMLPFLNYFSLRFTLFLETFDAWAFPSLLALFAVSSGVFVSGFADHKCTREDDN